MAEGHYPGHVERCRKQFNDAGIEVAVLCYNMQDAMTDDDIEYGFPMAKGLGVKAISTSTTLTMAKRIAPIADKHKLMVGYHGHDQTSDPNQTATLESYDSGGLREVQRRQPGHRPFHGGQLRRRGVHPEVPRKITNLHLKDRKKDHGPNVLWGTGDTPLKDVLQLLKKQKYNFPANIELEYRDSAGFGPRGRNEEVPGLREELPGVAGEIPGPSFAPVADER